MTENTEQKRPKVSIIIPTYNGADFLSCAIESVLNQTYDPIEIIVIDDGSSDGGATESIIRRYGDAVIYEKQDNRGPSNARNHGVQIATGEYIAFLDADDFFMPDKIEKQLSSMLKNDLSVSHTSFERVQIDKTHIDTCDTSGLKGNCFPRILRGCNIATPTVMVRKNILKDLQFPEGFSIGEDICLWIDLAYNYEFDHLNEPLTAVRVSEKSTSASLDKQMLGSINILSYIFHNKRYSQCVLEVDRIIDLMQETNFQRMNQSNFSKLLWMLKSYARKSFYQIGYFLKRQGKW